MSYPEARPGSPEYVSEQAAQNFNDQLRLQEANALMMLKEGRSEQIAYSGSQLPGALGMPGQIERRFLKEAALIKAATLAKVAAQGKDVDYNFILKEHGEKMRALVATQSLYLEVMGGEKVSTPKEAILVMSTIDEITLEQIDFFKRLQEAQRTGEIAVKDLEFVADELRAHFMREKGGSAVGLLMLHYLRPDHRMRLMRQMMQSPDKNKNMDRFMNDLVAAGYLGVNQAQELFQEEIDKLELEKKNAKGRKAKKAIDARIARLKSSSDFAGSDKMQKIQEFIEEKVKDQVKKVRRREYGHKNYAKGLLSGKGLISLLAFANGALTVAGNVLVSFPNPINMFANKCTLFGAGLMTGAVAWTKGFGGMMPTVGEAAAVVTRNKDEVVDDKRTAVIDRMRRLIKMNPVHSRFYYMYADLIVKSYEDQKEAGVSHGDIRITFDNLGKKYEDLPEQFRTKSKASLEKMMTTMVKTFSQEYQGLAIKSATDQKRWIDASNKEDGVKAFAGTGEDKPETDAPETDAPAIDTLETGKPAEPTKPA